jgi:hypothetical protein
MFVVVGCLFFSSIFRVFVLTWMAINRSMDFFGEKESLCYQVQSMVHAMYLTDDLGLLPRYKVVLGSSLGFDGGGSLLLRRRRLAGCWGGGSRDPSTPGMKI